MIHRGRGLAHIGVGDVEQVIDCARHLGEQRVVGGGNDARLEIAQGGAFAGFGDLPDDVRVGVHDFRRRLQTGFVPKG